MGGKFAFLHSPFIFVSGLPGPRYGNCIYEGALGRVPKVQVLRWGQTMALA